MIDILYALCREIFTLIGLLFIIIFALRLTFGAKAPDLTASLIKPMIKSMMHWIHWLWKETWKLSDKISRKLAKSAPAKLHPILRPAVQALIWVLILFVGSKLLR
jgi:hypothetical protein